MTKNYLTDGARVATRLATLFVGVALVMMVAAGVYSSAANTHSSRTVAELSGSSKDRDSVPVAFDDESQEAQENKRNETAPPAPPAPPQVTQPPSPPQATQPPSPPSDVQPPSQLSQPPSPPQDTQPPSQPPAAPQPATPPTPQPAPVAPAPPQDKSLDKNDKSSQEKKDVRVKGKLIEAPRPEYPQEAKDKRIEGSVSVNIVIGEEGKVISARATSGPEILHEPSVVAALKARFEPSTVNGKPAKVVGTMTYDFRLD